MLKYERQLDIHIKFYFIRSFWYFSAVMKILFTGLLITTATGCTQTENGLVFGVPDYEKREIAVSQFDLDIILSASKLLENEATWAKGAVSQCDESAGKFNLYCALELASIEVMGEYVHRQPALQEVRFAIDDHYRERWTLHRLADFNGHVDTTFDDIKSVIEIASQRIKAKLQRPVITH
jgi:hypothetical protein